MEVPSRCQSTIQTRELRDAEQVQELASSETLLSLMLNPSDIAFLDRSTVSSKMLRAFSQKEGFLYEETLTGKLCSWHHGCNHLQYPLGLLEQGLSG